MSAAPTLAHAERWGLEERLLGSVLAGRDPGGVLDRVTPCDFSQPGQRALCAFLQERYALGLPLDFLAVSDALMQSDPGNVVELLGGWEALGGRSLIAADSLHDEAIEDYIRTLKRASLADQQLGVMKNLARAILAGNIGPQEALRDTLQALMEKTDALEKRRRNTGEPVLEWPQDTWSRALYGIEQDMVSQTGPLGLSLGIPAVDDRLRPGLKPGRFWVIGAGTGEGKTVLAFMLALKAAREGKGVLYLSFEMSGEELLERAAAMETGLEWWQIQERELPEGEPRRKLTGWTPPPGLLVPTVAGLRARYIPRLVGRARRKLAEQGLALALVVVDHLQLVHSGEKVETRALEVKEAANLCKELALDGAGEGPLAVLALSQLRRARDATSPALFDLKESGGIEEAADTVLLLTRERREGRMTDKARLTVAKNRSGPIWMDPMPMIFDGTRARFR